MAQTLTEVEVFIPVSGLVWQSVAVEDRLINVFCPPTTINQAKIFQISQKSETRVHVMIIPGGS